MDSFFHLFGVSRILRRAAVLMRSIHLRLDDKQNALIVTVVCAIPWFSVTEVFPLDGSPGVNRRRDIRRGVQHGTMQGCDEHRGCTLMSQWGPPLAGWAMDEYRLVDKDVLHVHYTAGIGQQTAQFVAVYKRKE